MMLPTLLPLTSRFIVSPDSIVWHREIPEDLLVDLTLPCLFRLEGSSLRPLELPREPEIGHREPLQSRRGLHAQAAQQVSEDKVDPGLLTASFISGI